MRKNMAPRTYDSERKASLAGLACESIGGGQRWGALPCTMGVSSDGLAQAVAGGAASATTTLVLYPLDVIKTRLNRGTDEAGVRYAGVYDVIERQWRHQGPRGFYRGIRVLPNAGFATLPLALPALPGAADTCIACASAEAGARHCAERVLLLRLRRAQGRLHEKTRRDRGEGQPGAGVSVRCLQSARNHAVRGLQHPPDDRCLSQRCSFERPRTGTCCPPTSFPAFMDALSFSCALRCLCEVRAEDRLTLPRRRCRPIFSRR